MKTQVDYTEQQIWKTIVRLKHTKKLYRNITKFVFHWGIVSQFNNFSTCILELSK